MVPIAACAICILPRQATYLHAARVSCVPCTRKPAHSGRTIRSEAGRDRILPVNMVNHHSCTHGEWLSTFRDLHSSHETLNGREVLCLLRLPEASWPSASEASSSSPLQSSSSLCSARWPGESSVFGVWWVMDDMVVGTRDSSNRRRDVVGVLMPILTPHSAPSARAARFNGRLRCRSHTWTQQQRVSRDPR